MMIAHFCIAQQTTVIIIGVQQQRTKAAYGDVLEIKTHTL